MTIPHYTDSSILLYGSVLVDSHTSLGILICFTLIMPPNVTFHSATEGFYAPLPFQLQETFLHHNRICALPCSTIALTPSATPIIGREFNAEARSNHSHFFLVVFPVLTVMLSSSLYCYSFRPLVHVPPEPPHYESFVFIAVFTLPRPLASSLTATFVQASPTRHCSFGSMPPSFRSACRAKAKVLSWQIHFFLLPLCFFFPPKCWFVIPAPRIAGR